MSPLTSPGFWVIAVHRYGWYLKDMKTPLIAQMLRASYLILRLLVTIVTGARVNVRVKMGQRVTIHTTHGLIIANEATVGDGCVLNAGVNIVHAANNRGAGAPIIGDNVYLGVGAKILGGIRIGDHCQIGANAVVMRDVGPERLVLSAPVVELPRPGRKRGTESVGENPSVKQRASAPADP